MPWAIRPYSAMRLTFDLKLSQVSVVKFPGAGNRMQIDYLFGPLRKDYGRQGSSPLAIRVSEANAVADVKRFKAKWTHSVCGMTVEISPAANPQRPHPAYGPWYAVGNFPNGKRSFAITANTGQKLIQSLVCRLAGNLGN